MSAHLMLPFTVAFVARDHAVRNRYCYWNGAGQRIIRAMRTVPVCRPLPRPHAITACKGMMLERGTLATVTPPQDLRTQLGEVR